MIMLSKDIVYKIFNDDAMMGLVVILALAVIISIFDQDLSPGMRLILDGVNYFVIAAFIAEYFLKLYVEDESKISFITNPLHILDLFIIVIALLDFSQLASSLPIISRRGDLSPMLRLLRLPLRGLLAVSLAGKANQLASKDKMVQPPAPIKSLNIATYNEKGAIEYHSRGDVSFRESAKPLWIDFQDVTENDLKYIKEVTGIPQDEMKHKLIEGSFPRIDYIEEVPSILLWDYRANYQQDLASRMLIVLRENKIITLTTDRSELFSRIRPLMKEPVDKNFIIHVLQALFQLKITDYVMIVQEIENKVNEFERLSLDRTSFNFLHKTFLFKKEIQQVSDNLWHFHQVLDQLINKDDLVYLGIDESYRRRFNALHSESKYICRTARNVKESLESLIELHINNVSYDMNRVMKVIAVITCLAIVPSVIGGLLGVNLVTTSGSPIGFQLHPFEIFFLVCALMTLGLYSFYKLGWLR